jgi:hypothetical protein
MDATLERGSFSAMQFGMLTVTHTSWYHMAFESRAYRSSPGLCPSALALVWSGRLPLLATPPNTALEGYS